MMKKFLIVVILMMSAACAEAKNISIDNLIYRFNSVPGHSLSKQRMKFTSGAIDDVSETMAVLKKLGLNNLQSDTTNSIIMNGWKLFLTSNSLFGIMCGVEKP